jgi:hypothetical protein
MLWSKKSGGSINYQEEWYSRYAAENKPPQMKQTQPMSVGSAFDAEIKCYYCQTLGLELKDDKGCVIPTHNSDTLFEIQVEEQNRDWARAAGKEVFEFYKKCGACADLLLMLETSCRLGYQPRLEFSLMRSMRDITGKADKVTDNGEWNRVDKVTGVTLHGSGLYLLGRPDLHFKMADSEGRLHGIVLDWKINGFCSERTTSPAKGYLRCRPGGNRHKEAWGMKHVSGIEVNAAHPLELVSEEWAVQLSTYGFLLGEQIGGDFVTIIHQFCGPRTVPRFAEHVTTVTPTFQLGVIVRYKALWEIINSGYIFRDVSEEKSHARQEMLDLMYLAHEPDDQLGTTDMSKLYDRGEGQW